MGKIAGRREKGERIQAYFAVCFKRKLRLVLHFPEAEWSQQKAAADAYLAVGYRNVLHGFLMSVKEEKLLFFELGPCTWAWKESMSEHMGCPGIEQS